MIMNSSIKNAIKQHLPKKAVHEMLYFKHHHKFMSFKNPVTYDEKIHWLTACVYDSSYGEFADKYEVRKYIEKCGYSDMLIPLYGVWDSAADIDFDTLPKSYILKATHGSGAGYYEIVHDNDTADHRAIRDKLTKALNINYALKGAQYHYFGTIPRIICEELLTTPGKSMMDDYKIVCSYGKAKAVLVCTERDTGRDYFSPGWEYLPYVKEEYRSPVLPVKPPCLNDMLTSAEVISAPFPLARIDFYNTNDKIYFGEITLTPAEGKHKYLSDSGQTELGRLISLPEADR